jgi:hypothetical protein
MNLEGKTLLGFPTVNSCYPFYRTRAGRNLTPNIYKLRHCRPAGANFFERSIGKSPSSGYMKHIGESIGISNFTYFSLNNYTQPILNNIDSANYWLNEKSGFL